MDEDKKLIKSSGRTIIDGIILRSEKAWAISILKSNGEIATRSGSSRTLEEIPQSLRKFPFRALVSLALPLFLPREYLEIKKDLTKEDLAARRKKYFTLMSRMFLQDLSYAALRSSTQKIIGKKARNSLLFSVLQNLSDFAFLYSSFLPLKSMRQFHGAEHKVCSAIEKGVELKPENLGQESIFHAKCGSVLAFYAFLFYLPSTYFTNKMPFPYRNLTTFFNFLGSIIGSYELMRFITQYPESKISKILLQPALAFQTATVAEPEPEVLKTAIEAGKEILRLSK